METTEPLPAAVIWDKARLSEASRERITQLTGRDPWGFVVQAVLAWAVIAGAVGVALWAQNAWVTVFAIAVIGTRQNILGLLVHEQAHCLAFKAWPGDLIVNLICGYPMLLLTVEGYAQVHLSHHRFYFSERDPDFVRKSGKPWSMPMTRGQLARLFLTDLLGLNVVALIRGKRGAAGAPAFSRPKTPLAVRLGFYAAAATIITLTGGWRALLLYWVVPLVTVTQIIIRLGALSEHKYNLAGASVEASTPLIVPRWWERLLLPNLNFTFHAYHHFFPGIPFSRLPEVHRLFQRDGLVDERNVFQGYFAWLRAVTGG